MSERVGKNWSNKVLWGLFLGIIFISLIDMILKMLFAGQILPNTSLLGFNYGGLTRLEAYNDVDSRVISSDITFLLADEEFMASTEEIGINIDSLNSVNNAFKNNRKTPSILANISLANTGLMESGPELSYSLDEEKYNIFLEDINSKLSNRPIDAQLEIVDGEINITPSEAGNIIDTDSLQDNLLEAIQTNDSPSIRLYSTEVEANVKSEDFDKIYRDIERYLNTDVLVRANGKPFGADRAQKGYWLELVESEDGIPTIDINKEQVKGWVQAVANQVNQSPTSEIFRVLNGTSTKIQDGYDGIAIDQDLLSQQILDNFANKTNKEYFASVINIPFQTQYNTVNGLGSGTFIEISLNTQQMFIYENSEVIYTSPITSGATGQGFGTPPGTYQIYYKTLATYLNGASYGWDYNVYVDYWMPFYGGYGIHDADWRNGNFGGQDYYNGGSHGCVNVPKSTAAFIYSWAPVGTPVWVHY